MANRFDVSTTKKWKLDKRNRLIVSATPTRAGVFTYHEPDDKGGFKQVNELRHPDDVFSRETMDSLNVIPYTTQENHRSLMTTTNTRGKTYGMTMSGAKRVDNHAEIDIKITDQAEIDAVLGGDSLELSNGYTCDIKKESGTFEGKRYEQRQTNIIYDHVARVEKARGGESCRIRLDSECAICGVEAERLDSGELETSHSEEIMTEAKKEVFKDKELPKRELGGTERLDAEQITIPENQDANFQKMKDREDKLFAALEKSNSDNTAIQARVDGLESDNKELKKQVDGSIPVEKLDEAVKERSTLLATGSEYKIEKLDSMSNDEIRKACCLKTGKFNAERLDETPYLHAAFDQLDHKHEGRKVGSKANLELHQGGKENFDAYDEDISKPSRLEQA